MMNGVGVDIGAHHISAVGLSWSRGRWSVGRSVRFERAEPGQALSDREAERLMGVLERHGLGDDELVVALPPTRQFSGIMELPARSTGAPVGMLAREELGRQNRVEAAQLRCSEWELPAPTRGRAGAETAQVMAVGCLTTEAGAWVDPLIAAGASVRALDVRGHALCRGAGIIGPGVSPALGLTVDLERDAAMLVVAVGGVVVYERTLPEASLGLLHERASQRLGVEPAHASRVLEATPETGAERAWHAEVRTLVGSFVEDLAREVGVSVGYAGQRFPQSASGDSAPMLVVTGEGGGVPVILRRLSDRLGYQAQRPRLVAPGLAAALGLALHGVNGAAQPGQEGRP